MKSVYWIGYGIIASACVGGLLVASRGRVEPQGEPPWKVAINDGTVIRLQDNLARSYDSPPPVVDGFDAGGKFVVPPPPQNLPALPPPEFPEATRR